MIGKVTTALEQSNENEAIQAFGVTYLYPKTQNGQKRGICSLTASFSRGKVYAILGENGAGKTTLFHLLSGKLFPQQGQLYFHQKQVTQLPLWKRARLGLGYLSQAGTLVEHMTVEWNLKLAQKAVTHWPKVAENLEQKKTASIIETRQNEKLIRDSLAKLGVEYTYLQNIDTLSGGERRRVELARLLLTQPSIIILDEPFVALDEQGCRATIEFIEQARQWGALVLVTDHQKKYIEAICQEIIYLEQGRVTSQSSF